MQWASLSHLTYDELTQHQFRRRRHHRPKLKAAVGHNALAVVMMIATPLTHGMPSLVLLSISTESVALITRRVVLIWSRDVEGTSHNR